MKFLRMELLFLVWIVPLLALAFGYGLRKRRVLLARFADARGLIRLIPPGMAGRRRTQACLLLGSALLLVAALAGPQYGFEWQTIERQGVDLIIALDCSRSMLSEDIQPTRLDRAKREIVDLLAMLQGDRAGLVAFSGSAFLQCPLTVDYPAFNLFLSVLTPDYLPVGGTDLAEAVRVAVAAFDPLSAADKAVILITDGENTGRGAPLEAAQAAQKAGVKLFCIGVGSAEGVPVPAGQGGFEKDAGGRIVLSRLDESMLTRMAAATGGTYVRSVAGDMDLEAVYRGHIRSDMKSATVENGRKQVWADRYQWPLALAFVLLWIALLRPLTATSPKSLIVVVGIGLALAATQTPAQAGPLQDGYQAYQQGQYEQALKQLIDGQLEQPDDPRVLYNLGNTYYKNGDFEAARRHYDQALTQVEPPGSAPNSSDSSDSPGSNQNELKAQLLYNLGNTAFRRGELKEAVEKYQSALTLAPKDSQAAENLAFVQKQLEAQQNKQDGQGGPNPSQGEEHKQDQSQPKDASQSGQPSPSTKPDQNQGPSAAPKPPEGRDRMDEKDQGQAEAEDQPPPNTAQGQIGQGRPADRAEDQSPELGAQLLNRLKDEPGRAMMPQDQGQYQKQQVDKDW